VVLMDVQMPELDGLEATRRLRAELPPHRQPWVVAMTASALAEDRDRCAAAGMDDYLAKPVRREELAAALAHVAVRPIRQDANRPDARADTPPGPEPAAEPDAAHRRLRPPVPVPTDGSSRSGLAAQLRVGSSG
jgi:DNA-binding response OmpR family regulator